mmetsp:Transcript_17421/g.48115  ORF Transcript_17421/g.48115 Transcript_17421/m.48115 type:complete len:100 (-) Transcript_17421:1283-1582(-)
MEERRRRGSSSRTSCSAPSTNPGGKHLCVVRDPAATLLSWFAFQKAKGRPGFVEYYEDANEVLSTMHCLAAGTLWRQEHFRDQSVGSEYNTHVDTILDV